MSADCLRITKCSRIDCHKSMADSCFIRECATMIRSNTHRKNGTEQFTQHTISISLVASCNLFISTKGHDSTALLCNNIGKDIRCICTCMTIFVQRPSIRKRFLHFVVHFEFSSCNYRGRRVKEKRIRICRHSYCDWV